jgi:hypothetical protein
LRSSRSGATVPAGGTADTGRIDEDDMREAWHERGWGRFLMEYVGNIDAVDRRPQTIPSPAPAERRINHRGRALVDWFRRELAVRRLPAEKQAELLDGMRDAVRTGETDRE